MADKLAPSKRHQFQHQGRVVYEWDQTFQEVNIYVEVPKGVKAKDLYCEIKPNWLKFGLGSSPPYIDMELSGPVKTSESYWTLEDGTLHITLTKLHEGEPWPSALKGHDIDILAQQQESERLMLERFQQENPGFDFSGAKFSGQVPNPRTFMKDLE